MSRFISFFLYPGLLMPVQILQAHPFHGDALAGHNMLWLSGMLLLLIVCAVAGLSAENCRQQKSSVKSERKKR